MQWIWQLFPKSGQTPPIRWREAILCDNNLGKGATAGENTDAARPGCFAAPTALCSDGRVPEDGEQGGVSGGV